MAKISQEVGNIQTNKIHSGDCAFVLKQHVPDNSVDLIVTSPPYLDARKGSYKSVSLEHYERWFLDRAKEFKRVLKPTGSFVLNIKNRVENGERLTYVLDLVIAMREVQHWLWVDEFIWHKTNPFPNSNMRRLKDGWEPLYHFAKTKNYQCHPDALLFRSKSNYAGDGKRRINQGPHASKNGSGMGMSRRFLGDLVRPSNVIHCPTSNVNLNHTAAFPETIPDFFIRLFTREGEVVLDPFAGSGTTCIAAKKAKRRFIGIDIMEENVNLINQRIDEGQ